MTQEQLTEKLKLLNKHLKNASNVVADIITLVEIPKAENGEPEKKKTRKPNPIWDALCEHFRLKPQTKSELARVGKLCRDLKIKAAMPDQIPRYIWAYKNAHPTWDLTPEALVKHWDSCAAYFGEWKNLYSEKVNGTPTPEGDRNLDYVN